MLYYMLSQHDDDFAELFKIAADFDDRVARTGNATLLYARVIATTVRREHLRERLLFYDMQGELALYAHHPLPDIREAAQDRIARLLSGHNHLDGLIW